MHSQKTHLVVGLGKTGISCVRYLKKIGHEVAVVDSRKEPPELSTLKADFPDVPVVLGTFDTDLFSKASVLIVSPGISLKEPAIAAQIARGIPAIGDVELFARSVKAPIVAITGSNGKSTVTTLVGEMAKAAGLSVVVGGNLGTPVLDLLSSPEPDLYVLELSSFQLETTFSLKPAAAVVLNVTPDHMDRYADFAAYLKAKQLIYRSAKTAILNRDDPPSYTGVDFSQTKTLSFGLETAKNNEFGLQDGFLTYGKEKLIASKDLKIKGRHQIANALAALALGHAVKLPFSAMCKALADFPGLMHRCTWIRNLNGVDFYNDSKGTNVGATLAAISGLGEEIRGKIILIAGGLGKDADFSELKPAMTKYVSSVILIGKDAKKIAADLANTVPILFASSMQEAVETAYKQAKSGDSVLLSPACASFDMFKNFEHRGEVFTRDVRNLK
ncbi:MAG: UDP-N-acetylmuramoyl-L-alanine--D-glutamate ligase [Gammaproteobacteria bacterium]